MSVVVQTGGKVTCHNSRTARNLADVARRTVRLPRVATRGRPAPCAELARCVRRRPRVTIAGSNRGRRPPRVTIVVPTPPRVAIVVPTPPRVAIVDGVRSGRPRDGRSAPSSCRYRGTNPSSRRYRGANPSSCRYRWLKPGGNSRWQPGGCVNIHTVRIRVARCGSNPGGK